ncbi:light-harvesting protein [Ideonella sp. A 288]|uniref:light-harvesting protein n=1 Tax=Ideonella sp. A 288 TaxID=1962181 RepID=UPI000B4A76ED|nr:light-harvesting protein [Ideonella sp. A 288]
MNQGKIWLVVKPTVGLPLFLGGVTVIALSVHAAILTHTDWYPGYYSGKAKAKVATAPAAEVTAPVAAAAPTTLIASAEPAKAPTGTTK